MKKASFVAVLNSVGRMARRVSAVVVASAVLLAGCATDDADNATDTSTATSTTTTVSASQNAEASAYPVTVKHTQGETTLDKAPETVVVMDYAALDAVDSLGFGATVAGGAWAFKGPLPGVAKRYADNTENVGSLFEPDFEKIADLNPDLIIIANRSAKLYKDMSEIAPTIDTTFDRAYPFEATRQATEAIGAAYGVADEAKAEIDALSKSYEEAKKKITARNATALVVMTNGGEVSAYGETSRFGLIYDLGFTPAAEVKMDGNHGEAISFEYIADADPDYLFVLDRDAAVGSESGTAEATLDNDLVKSTKAAKNDNIIYLPSDEFYIVGGGPGTFAGMIDAVAAAVED